MNQTDTAGFMRLIIILTAALLLIAFSGIDIPQLPDQLNPDTLQSWGMILVSHATDAYQTYINGRLDELVIKPSFKVLRLVDTYVINAIKQVLQTVVLDTPPILGK